MHGEFYQDPAFWSAVGLFLFLALIVWKKVPGVVGKMLDDRSAAIAQELFEAQRLREEAEDLLSSYKTKAAEAEREAEEIIALAKSEAVRLQEDGQKSLEALIARRTKMAEDKIAQAESTALAEVKAAAASAAVSILGERVTGAKASSLTDASIRDLRAKLN